MKTIWTWIFNAFTPLAAIKLFVLVQVAGILACWVLHHSILTQYAWAKEKDQPTEYLVRNGQAQAVIVIGTDRGPFYRFVAEELQKYFEKLSGARLDIVTTQEARSKGKQTILILVGGPEANELAKEAADKKLVSFTGLKPDGFILRRIRLSGQTVLIVGGNDEASTMYAAYDLLERYGIVFQLTMDIIPERKADLVCQNLDVRAETPFTRRGLFISNIYPNRSIWSFEDCQKFIDQMAKLKFNYLQFFWFPYEPWIMYEYKGEKKLIGDVAFKEGGYTLWQYNFGSHKAEDIVIGREHFERFGKKWMAPRELQEAKTPEEAVTAAQNLLRRIISYAKNKKIKTWLCIDINSLPPNLARYCRRTGWLPFHPIFGTFVCPTDPAFHEINEIRLRALVETYPEAEGYFLYIPEHAPVCYHESDWELIRRDRPKYYDEIEKLAAPWWGVYSAGYRVDSMDTLVDSNIGSIYLIQKMLEARNRINPKIKLGVGGIGRGFLLPVLDKVLPKDVPFTDMESSGVWTPDGVPMKVFGGMGERERTLIPRGDDDGSMLGMQFNVGLYYWDRALEGSVENGVAGFAIQMNRARGTEQNIKFFSMGAWNPKLTPDEFYRDYVSRIFGKDAQEEMFKTYEVLEQNEKYLGWRGMGNFPCCGPPPEIRIINEYAQQANPYDGPKMGGWPRLMSSFENKIRWYSKAIEFLKQALQYMEAAAPKVAARGQIELAYLRNRTEAYILHLETMVQLERAYLRFDEAFKIKAKGGNHEEFIRVLDDSLKMFEQAHQKGLDTAKKWSEMVDHLSDLGVLYRINTFMVTGTNLVAKFMRNINNFHHGRPYLDLVPLEKVFSPWPKIQTQ